MTELGYSIQSLKAAWRSLNVRSSETVVTTFNRMKRLIPHLVLQHLKEPEVAAVQIKRIRGTKTFMLRLGDFVSHLPTIVCPCELIIGLTDVSDQIPSSYA
jgi:hypothetical protein